MSPVLLDKNGRSELNHFVHFAYLLSLFAKAAPTNPLIKRCGRFGREINSGWN